MSKISVDCKPCSTPMEKLFQAIDPTAGVPTHVFHCRGCGGRIGVQDDSVQPASPAPPLIPSSAPEVLEVVREEIDSNALHARLNGIG